MLYPTLTSNLVRTSASLKLDLQRASREPLRSGRKDNWLHGYASRPDLVKKPPLLLYLEGTRLHATATGIGSLTARA